MRHITTRQRLIYVNSGTHRPGMTVAAVTKEAHPLAIQPALQPGYAHRLHLTEAAMREQQTSMRRVDSADQRTPKHTRGQRSRMIRRRINQTLTVANKETEGSPIAINPRKKWTQQCPPCPNRQVGQGLPTSAGLAC